MPANSNELSDSPGDQAEYPVVDYFFLRKQALQYLERLTGAGWSDFNTHDPGITIVEQLCYALSDLSYRTSYPLEDLLYSESEAEGESKNEGQTVHGSIYSPDQVLPTAPVTLADLRKYIIDLPSVKNTWIDDVNKTFAQIDTAKREVVRMGQSVGNNFSPNLAAINIQGLLRVSLEKRASDARHEAAQRLHQSRGLGQDFAEINDLGTQLIGVEAVLEIEAVEGATALLAAVYRQIADYMSPPVPLQSLSAMQQCGRQIDEIFEGPLLDQGFIDNDDLAKTGRRTAVRVSDIINQLMSVSGIVAVKHIRLRSGDGENAIFHPWSLDVAAGTVASFKHPSGKAIDIQLESKGVPIVDQAMQTAAVERFNKLRESTPQQLNVGIEKILQPPRGRDRRVGGYTSIMNQFPRAYGVGSTGLPESASVKRQAMVKQLKAYLLLFDQLLANQFAQLANVSTLFSLHAQTTDSYFSQAVEDDGLLDLDSLRVSSADTHRQRLRELTENSVSSLGNTADSYRCNRFLDHLLARFGQQFHNSAHLPEEAGIAEGHTHSKQQAQRKRAFLRDYPRIGHDRGTGFNCLEPAGPENISGLERVLACKLGVSHHVSESSFYLVEHVLLRPLPGDDRHRGPLLRDVSVRDPYSLQVTLIFPDWPARYQNRQLIEQMVQEETPAHLTVHVLWKTEAQMSEFTAAYQLWLQRWRQYRHVELATLDGSVYQDTQSIPVRCARNHLIDLLGIADAYPLTDLNVVADYLKVPYNATAKIPIEHAQKGVIYQLCDASANPLGEAFRKVGTGETLIIETPEVVEDITYRIEIIKQSHLDQGLDLPRRFLNENAPVKVGLNTELEVRFAQHEALATLDSANLNPQPSHPRIVSYGEKDSIDVEVLKSQEGVEYTLLLNGKLLDGNVQPSVTGDLGTIALATGPINEDTTIRVQATKSFSEESGRPDEVEVLNAVIFLKVRANPELAVAVKGSPVIAFRQNASIVVSASQTSARYRALIRLVEDYEFVRGGRNQNSASITVPVANKPDVQVRQPASAGSVLNGNDIPAGYRPVTDFVAGTGGNIELPLNKLEEDSLVLIQAVKDHQLTANSQETISSSITLAESAVALVEPDPSRTLTLSAPAEVAANTDAPVTVSGGQPGIFYYFRTATDGPEFPLPAYFHQRDIRNTQQNKGIGQIEVAIDFVITDSPTDSSADNVNLATTYPPAPVVDMVGVAVDSVLFVRAVKAQTGVEVAMADTVTIAAAPTPPVN